MMRRLGRVTFCFAVAWWAAPVEAASDLPDFTASEIRMSPQAPREADIVSFEVVLKNTGTDRAGAVCLSTEWPLMGFLVDVTGLDDATIDHDARTIISSFALPAGAERRYVVRVLAPRDSGGDTLTLAIHATHFASTTEHWDRASVTIDTRPGTGGVIVGGLRVTRAGLATLAVLGIGALLWLALTIAARAGLSAHAGRGNTMRGAVRRRTGAGAAAAAAITIALGFWTIFAVMAWRDYQSLTRWPATTCTILGGRLSEEGTTRTRSTNTTQARQDDTNYVPVLGLRYLVDGRETLSSGYDTGSHIGIGGQGGRTSDLSHWTVGGSTACWYNPADPLDVVVVNGFGGAYVFALIPLPVFWIGITRARRSLRRH